MQVVRPQMTPSDTHPHPVSSDWKSLRTGPLPATGRGRGWAFERVFFRTPQIHLVVKVLMTLPRPLGDLRNRPIYRGLARTYYHVANPVSAPFRMVGPDAKGICITRLSGSVFSGAFEGRLRGWRLVFPGPNGICSTGVYPRVFHRGASRGRYGRANDQ